MKTRAHIIVSGRVQNVCFRYFTKRNALKFDLKGWVRNKPDGTVEIISEGEKENIHNLISWCKRGPTFAKVKDIKIKFLKYKNEFSSFDIRYGPVV